MSPPRKKLRALPEIYPLFQSVAGADLMSLPPEHMQSYRPTPRNEITLPDLHGNALKLAWYQAGFDILSIDDELYAEAVRIYLTAEQNNLTAADLNRWAEIFCPSFFDKNAGRIRLIGDELCDRGANDWLMLKLIESMHEAGVLAEIIISNHSLEFIINAEKLLSSGKITSDIFLKTTLLNGAGNTDRSMRNLRTLIDKNLIPVTEKNVSVHGRSLSEIYRECYLPHLQAVHFDMHFEPPVFFSHAPFNTEYLWELAIQLQPDAESLAETEFKTAEDMSNTICAINRDFSTRASSLSVHELLKYDDALENRFVELCWNRNYSELTLFGVKDSPKLQTTQVHGHDSDDPRTIADGVFALDDTFGKGDSSLWRKTSAPCLFARRHGKPPCQPSPFKALQ